MDWKVHSLLHRTRYLLCYLRRQRKSGMINSIGQDELYSLAIERLNALQSNSKTIALNKYDNLEEKLPLFTRQLELAGISVSDLDKLNVIHVAGTKGKGSTCAFIESIVRLHGYKTGFYNSPHLITVNERIRLNGFPISPEKFGHYFNQVYDRLQGAVAIENISMPTYFSFLTILAFHIFLVEKVDCAIIEVGIGGEFDSTNVVPKPVACGITTLDYDHTNILGKSIQSIARAKAGICKTAVPLYTVEQAYPESLPEIRAIANGAKSQLYICRPLRALQYDDLGIKGQAQAKNAALACHLSRYFLATLSKGKAPDPPSSDLEIETDLSDFPSLFRKALKICRWDGRCQKVELSRITYFLDGAHTKKSMENCLDWFVSASLDKSQDSLKVLLLYIQGHRDRQDIISPLVDFETFEFAIFASCKPFSSDSFVSDLRDKSSENVRMNVEAWSSLSSNRMKKGAEVIVMGDLQSSLSYIEDLSKKKPEKRIQVLVTGSLHFVGAALASLDKIIRVDNT